MVPHPESPGHFRPGFDGSSALPIACYSSVRASSSSSLPVVKDDCDNSRDGFKKVHVVFTAFGEQLRPCHNQWPCSYRLVTSESHSYIVEDEPTLIHALTGWKQTH